MGKYWRVMSQENVERIRRGWEHWVSTGELRVHVDLVWDVCAPRLA